MKKKTQFTKQLVSIFLCLVMLLTYVPTTVFGAIFDEVPETADDLTVTIDTGASVTLKDTDDDIYYEIGTADELYAFAAAVNSGRYNIYGELTANIVVNEDVLTADGSLNGSGSGFRVWTPIGTSDAIDFRGVFEGNGHTVSGLYLNGSGQSFIGLFGYVGGNHGKVQNIGVIDSYFNGEEYVGAVVGFSDGTVENCYNTGTVRGYSDVGGVVGHSFGTVKNCHNSGTVKGIENIVGGVVGSSNQATIQSCYNVGTVIGRQRAGGVLGHSDQSTVQNCYNTGSVSGDQRVGGVLGHNYLSTVQNCYYLTGTATGGIGGADAAGQAEAKDSEWFEDYPDCKIVGYNHTLTAATCTVPGTCTVCGENYGEVDPTAHSGGEATCSAQAVCEFCGESYGEVDPDRHSGGNATCSAQAVCEFCGESYGEFDPDRHSGGNATCAEPAVCENCGVSYGSTDLNKHDGTVSFDNGFCPNCDEYEPAVLVTNENYTELGLNADYIGYYAITNAGQLYWFADKVDNDNANFGEANVVLTDNITVNEGTVTAASADVRVWNPVGDSRISFGGIFDGNGKTVSGLYYNDSGIDYIGFVAYVAEGGIIKNVTLSNSYIYGKMWVGGIVGKNKGTISGCVNNAAIGGDGYQGGIVGKNEGTVELCGNTGTITNTWCYSGGIAGCNYGPVRNCWNMGSFLGKVQCAGGIVGRQFWMSYRESLTENCWSMGLVDGTDCGGIIWEVNLDTTVRNCYSNMETLVVKGNGNVENVGYKPTEAFASGEVAYLLGGVWGQNIDNGEPVQTVPVFSDAKVYKNTDCTDVVSYSNAVKTNLHSLTYNAEKPSTCAATGMKENWHCSICGTYFSDENGTTEIADLEIPKKAHVYTNGFCEQVSGETHYEPAVLVTAENCAELGLSESYIGYYAIANAGQLYWFADKVDNDNANFGEANVVLTDNITVNEGTVTASSSNARVWNPVGDNNMTFGGIFDGNGKTVSGLYYNDTSKDTGSYIGLVAWVTEGGTVKNVTLSNSYIYGYMYTAGIAGRNYGTISGCVNNATIGGAGFQGGIVGENYGTVELCGNTGTITNTWCYSGGIAGGSYGTIRNCWNTGSVSAELDAGGIVGCQLRRSGNPLTENCWSTGNVSGGRELGGIAGRLYGKGTVRNCYSDKSTLVGSKFQSGADSPTVTNVQYRSTAAFASGEVAYLLGGVWGQNIDNGEPVQNVPVFSDAKVYYGYVSCSNTEKVYTNNSTAGETKPDHNGTLSYAVDSENSTKHIATYSCCGSTFTEAHTLTYSASGNVISETCSLGCGYIATATISAETATYNGTEQKTATVAYSEGWQGGELTVSYENNVNAGTATASITLDENCASVEFTIEKAKINGESLVFPEFAKDLVYDGTAKALVTAPGSVTGGTFYYSLIPNGGYTTDFPVATEAGEYSVYWLVRGDENHKDLGGPGEAHTIVTIAAKPVADATVTFGEYDSVYNGAAKEPDVASVVVDGKTLTAGKDYDVSYANNVCAGNANAVITFKGNFTGTVTKTFTIGKAAVTEPTVESKIYNGSVQIADISDTDLYAVVKNEGGTKTGSYDVVLKLKDSENYKWSTTESEEATVQFEITTAQNAWDIAPEIDGWTYGETAKTPVGAAKFGDFKVVYSGEAIDGSDYNSEDAPTKAGNYTATFIVDETADYSGLSEQVDFTIAKKAITVTADDAGKNYGNSDPELTCSCNELVGSDRLDIIVTRESGENVNTYTITASQAEGANPNYEITFKNGTFSIHKAALTVTAEDKSVTYGDEAPEYTVKIEGFRNGDDESDLGGTLGFYRNYEQYSDVGEYEIKPYGLEADNYVFFYYFGTLTVSPKEITVTIKNAASVYGDELSEPEATDNGIVNGDTNVYSISTTATSTSNVGKYEITGTALDSNYEVTFVNGEYEITKREITIAAEDKTAVVNTALPTYTYKVEGLVGEDKLVTEPVITCDADITAIGEYGITVDGADAGGNYTVKYVPAKLTVIADDAADAAAGYTEELKDYDPETVTGEDKAALEEILDEIDDLLDDENITDNGKKALEEVKETVEELLKKISDAAASTDTENTEKVEDVTTENVTPEDKIDLESAKADLEKALEDHGSNMTEDEKKAIEDEIERIDGALEVIGNVEKVEEIISKLPAADAVEPDDEEAIKAITDAQTAYNALSDYEKSLVDKAVKENLDKLMAVLVAYDIVEGDGSAWTEGSDGSITFVVNGLFSKFVGIKVDGKDVDKANYDAKAGSTIITLKTAFLDTLEVGEHTITVIYTDGETDGTFYVHAKANSPETGNNNNLGLWMALLLVSGGAVTALSVAGRKKRAAKK